MILIKAVSFNGQAMPTALGAEFGEEGGIIGRGTGNALVLPDPERFVSRTHAAIAFRAGTYVIRDLSSASPVYVNGIPLGNGREAKLTCGDELRIGAYALLVEAPPPANQHTASIESSPIDDPLGLFGGTSMACAPWQGSKAPASGRGSIPDDFDPFADLSPSHAEPQAPSQPDDFHLGLEPSGGSDINRLFGLGAGASGGLFPDGHPLAENAHTHGPVDPLVALGAMQQPQWGANSQRDDAPEIYASFVPPMSYAGNQQKAQESVQGDLGSQRQGAAFVPAGPTNMVVSWNTENEQAPGSIKTLVMGSPGRTAAKAVASAPDTAQPTLALPDPAVVETPAAPSARVEEAELLKAFLEGAGVPDLEMGAPLTPEMMAMFGQLLRESMKGTLDLLMARAMTKREMHAQMTVISMHENNPLKFSPNVEVALHSVLAPRGKGFMPPVPAMKDAYDDLRAHQFGVMAGMRAALSRVLQRFDPVHLEERLTDNTLVDSLLPANRKAKLWTQYLDLYADITKEAEDDFQIWFGREFLSAYEAQMAKLKQDGQQG
ncbi:type VI secretion system-associated FHA domain protein TagH [Pseudoduganella violaceinigra]|uniref:type VI secretion system-associated FHA domain protein TagH n=1 Tax=Pseudoduganella violaceinigra TaxID=246602 RepID=UPI0003F7A865|nr:type VI secretion system-associated FHA domain protein TagH [Pseudoduganella violaceinigra]